MAKTPSKRTALIIGASGLTGSHCLDYLLNSDSYEKVTALVRSSLKKTHPKLKEVIINFDKIEEHETEILGEDIYCAIGTTVLKTPSKEDYFRIDYTYPYEIAKIALKNGAKRFALVSSLAANPKGLLFYSRVKGQIEDAISSLPFQSVYHFRPSYLLGEREENRPIEKTGQIVLTVLKPILLGPLRKYRAIEAKAVAYAMVQKSIEAEASVHVISSDEIQALYDKSSKD